MVNSVNCSYAGEKEGAEVYNGERFIADAAPVAMGER